MLTGILVMFVLVGLPIIGLVASDQKRKARNTVPPAGSSQVPPDVTEVAARARLGQLDLLLPGFTCLTFGHTTVWVFRNGLVTRDDRRPGPCPYRWHDCSLQYRRILSTGTAGRGLIESFTLHGDDGTQLAVRNQNNDAQTTALLKVLIDRTTEALLPIAWSSVRDGGELDFGPVQCSRSHLRVRGRNIVWGEIETIEIRQGSVYINLRGKMLAISVPAPNLTDVHVFLGLAELLRRDR